MVAQNVVSPLKDKLQYQEITLSNGVRVILVSDATTEKAAAAVNVRVGSLSDPQEFPGLAHFLEHMLFYSSEKYPVEDEYMKFVADHGGSTNAFTTVEDTNYYFDVNEAHLEEALDRFAQFFCKPLISSEGVDREAHAVDSEHAKNINSDVWRRMQLWRHMSNPAHPFSRFHTGSLQTLITEPTQKGLDPHAALLDFYHKHYCASVMTCCIYGRQSLDELAQLARATLDPVPNHGISSPSFSGDISREEDTAQLVRVVPQREGHSLELHWAIPPQQPQWRSRPADYLSHLIGHEGGGSLLAELKRRQWATELVAGEASSSFSGRSIFMVQMALTDAGQEAAADALALVFAYIRMLTTEHGVTPERFREVQALRELEFNFADRPRPQSYAQGIASTMQLVPGLHTLTALHNVPLEYDEGAIQAVLDSLQPESAVCMWSSKDFQGKTNSKEPWYGTEYSREGIPADWLDKWQSTTSPELRLPSLNPFIPTNFDMLPDESPAQQPSIVLETPLTTCWHRLNTSFDLPKAVVKLLISSPVLYASPEAAVLSTLLVDILQEQLTEVAYDAQLAGLSSQASSTNNGLLLQFSGYNDKMLDFIQLVLQRLLTFTVDDALFQVRKEALRKYYNNIKYLQPYQLAMNVCEVMLEYRRWNWREYIAIIPDVTVEEVQSFHRTVFRRCHLQWHLTGNISRDTAIHTAQQAEKLLQEHALSKPTFPSQRTELRTVQLPAGRPALRSEPGPNPENDNSAIFLEYQVGLDDVHRLALADLLVNCASQEAFTQLRTREQLGYTVSLTRWRHLTMHSIALILQANAYAAPHLEDRSEAFLQDYERQLSGMDASTFESQVEQLIQQKLEEPKFLRHQAQREWREIQDGTLRFQRVAEEVAALRQLTHAELVSFYQENVLRPDKRRKLAVHLTAAQSDAAQTADASSNGDVERATSADEQSRQENGVLSASAADTDGDETAAQTDVHAAQQANGTSEQHMLVRAEVVANVWEWKRRQTVAPSPR